MIKLSNGEFILKQYIIKIGKIIDRGHFYQYSIYYCPFGNHELLEKFDIKLTKSDNNITDKRLMKEDRHFLVNQLK